VTPVPEAKLPRLSSANYGLVLSIGSVAELLRLPTYRFFGTEYRMAGRCSPAR